MTKFTELFAIPRLSIKQQPTEISTAPNMTAVVTKEINKNVLKRCKF